jgi:hypothetical protein
MEVDTPATERIEGRKDNLRTGREVSGASRRSEWRILRDHIERKKISDKSECIGNCGSYQTLSLSGHIATFYGEIMNLERISI